MDFIAGVNRQQMQLSSMEDAISQDNIVRFVDAFVEKLDIEKLGFKVSLKAHAHVANFADVRLAYRFK